MIESPFEPLSSHPSSPSMISTIPPPPRPVSVNSLPSDPSSVTLSYQKSNRSTSAGIQTPDDAQISTVSSPAQAINNDTSVDTEMDDAPVVPPNNNKPTSSVSLRSNSTRFDDLPIEIHEAILDHLFGERASTFTTASPGKAFARNWAKALRHPRRKVLSNLALISSVWRPLVQDRIYRHIEIKGTLEGLKECHDWFRAKPQLASYVRHIEFWVPVWGNRTNKNGFSYLPPTRRHNNNSNNNNEDAGLANAAAMLQITMAWNNSITNPASRSTNHHCSRNASLEDIFWHVKTLFPEARILTIEGGDCKDPPMIRHFKNDPSGRSGRERLEVLPHIHTFVMRGAWNIMRDYRQWCNLARALPNLREWHCAYAKPRLDGHNTVANILWELPPSIVHANISLEGFYNKDSLIPNLFGVSQCEPHLCTLLGNVASRLESLSFTGNVCACLFNDIQKFACVWNSPPKLKSLDLVVKTCCREMPLTDESMPLFDDVSGITNMNFIASFERLVLAAVRSLEVFTSLNYIRIRFIDLDSACPPLNPYFQLVNNSCSGLWSYEILEELRRVRPQAQYMELSDGIYPQYDPSRRQIIGAIYPRARPLSIHAGAYKIISDASKL